MSDITNYLVISTVEPPRSGQSRTNSVRISELSLVQYTKPGKRTVMGTYLQRVPFHYRAAICTLYWRICVCFLGWCPEQEILISEVRL